VVDVIDSKHVYARMDCNEGQAILRLDKRATRGGGMKEAGKRE